MRRTTLRRSKPVAEPSRSARRVCNRLMAGAMDGMAPFEIKGTIPEVWDMLEQDIDVFEKKVQVSPRLDESVVQFHRAMGRGVTREATASSPPSRRGALFRSPRWSCGCGSTRKNARSAGRSGRQRESDG